MKMENQENQTLWETVWSEANRRFGEPLPAPVAERLQQERDWVEQGGYTEQLFELTRLATMAQKAGCPVTVRDVGASLVAFFAGLTEINPLPPHYLCPHCRHTEWHDDGSAYIGLDLPEKACPTCGALLAREGYRIPAESFFRQIGPGSHRFVVNAAADMQPQLRAFLDSLPNRPKTALRIFDEGEKLGALRKLQRATGVPVREIPPQDSALLAHALPQVASAFLRKLFAVAPPQKLSDCIRLYGLSLGQNTWVGNAEEWLTCHACSLTDVVASREDLFYALRDRGVDPERARAVANAVSHGRGLTDEQAAVIQSAGLPGRYVESCRKIRYLSPKSLAVAYALTDVRLAWYQLHFPAAYAACTRAGQRL